MFWIMFRFSYSTPTLQNTTITTSTTNNKKKKNLTKILFTFALFFSRTQKKIFWIKS